MNKILLIEAPSTMGAIIRFLDKHRDAVAEMTGIPKCLFIGREDGPLTKQYNPNKVVITIGGIKIDPTGYITTRYLNDTRPRWQCSGCGRECLPNTWVGVCVHCRELGCKYCLDMTVQGRNLIHAEGLCQ